MNFFEVSGKSHCTEKCKRAPLAVFQHPFFCKIGKKMKSGPFRDIKKLRKKVSQSRKKSTQKKFGRGRDSNPCPSAWQTSKSVTSMPVWFSVSARQC